MFTEREKGEGGRGREREKGEGGREREGGRKRGRERENTEKKECYSKYKYNTTCTILLVHI